MAAETLSSTRAAATQPTPSNSFAGVCQANYGAYAVAANVEDGDIFEMFRVPDGAIVLGGQVYGDDMDTGIEALDMDIGWAANSSDAADPDGFGNLGIWTGDGTAGIAPDAINHFVFGGVLKDGPKAFTAGGGATMVQIEANAAATTFAAGDMWAYAMYLTA